MWIIEHLLEKWRLIQEVVTVITQRRDDDHSTENSPGIGGLIDVIWGKLGFVEIQTSGTQRSIK